jgi:t-SNARE complex subunit (syntaxin)
LVCLLVASAAESVQRLIMVVRIALDSIENNIIQSVDNTRKGVATLEQAKGYQESSRSKLYCVALIIIVILVILVVLAALGVSIKYLF